MKGHLEAAYLVNFPAFPNSRTSFRPSTRRICYPSLIALRSCELADCFTNFKGPSGFKNPSPRTPDSLT